MKTKQRKYHPDFIDMNTSIYDFSGLADLFENGIFIADSDRSCRYIYQLADLPSAKSLMLAGICRTHDITVNLSAEVEPNGAIDEYIDYKCIPEQTIFGKTFKGSYLARLLNPDLYRKYAKEFIQTQIDRQTDILRTKGVGRLNNEYQYISRDYAKAAIKQHSGYTKAEHTE